MQKKKQQHIYNNKSFKLHIAAYTCIIYGFKRQENCMQTVRKWERESVCVRVRVKAEEGFSFILRFFFIQLKFELRIRRKKNDGEEEEEAQYMQLKEGKTS